MFHPAVVLILLFQGNHMNILISPFYIGSYHLLLYKGWTRLGVLIIVATTSKICSGNPSTYCLQYPSLLSPCQSTNIQVSQATSPPSILVYPKFDRYVLTRFLADSNFHGHRPTVLTWSSTLLLVVALAAYPVSSFFASCRSCLPQSAHWSRSSRHTL